MNSFKENLTIVSGISYKANLIDMSFQDEILEGLFTKSILDDEIQKSKIFTIFFCNCFLISLIFSISIMNLRNFTTLVISSGFVIEIILTTVIIYKKNYRFNRILNIARFFLLSELSFFLKIR